MPTFYRLRNATRCVALNASGALVLRSTRPEACSPSTRVSLLDRFTRKLDDNPGFQELLGKVRVTRKRFEDLSDGRAVMLRDPDVGSYVQLWQPNE